MCCFRVCAFVSALVCPFRVLHGVLFAHLYSCKSSNLEAHPDTEDHWRGPGVTVAVESVTPDEYWGRHRRVWGGVGHDPPPESSREKTRFGSEPTPERCVSRAFCSLSAQERFVHGPGCTRTVLQSSKVDIPERSMKGRQRTLRKMSRCKLFDGVK